MWMLDQGGIDALRRHLRLQHVLAEKGIEDLVAAATVARARQMLLGYAIDSVEVTGFDDLESEAAREAARKEVRLARELSERSLAVAVDDVANDWDSKVPAWIERSDDGVDPEAS